MSSLLYRTLTDLGAPFIHVYLRRRLAAGREDSARFHERLGQASHIRPTGFLVWCHAASVGEAVSLLALIKKINLLYPHISILVTTGTVSSAHLLEGRLPPHVLHQYIPVDRMAYVTKFLNYWHPDFVIWVESELWPNLLSAVQKRRIPAVLLNGRMSDKSYRKWLFVKNWIRSILSTFDLCLTQTDEEKLRFTSLGAKKVECCGNLKYAAEPLPFDPSILLQLQHNFKDRLVWLAASTHPGEEELLLAAHQELKKTFPNLLTIMVPRHAIRGQKIAQLLQTSGCSFARRSHQEMPSPTTDIYLADTMGELGLFYRLAPIVVIGGSFVPVGGHNPIEPAQCGAVILFGPYMDNFNGVAKEFINQKAALSLSNIGELVPTLKDLLYSTEEQLRYSSNSKELAKQKQVILDHILKRLEPWLSLQQKTAA